MRVAVAGSSGFLGSELLPSLRSAGHDVVRLVRRPPRSTDEVSWDPASGTVDTALLEGVDAIINLAGAGIGDKRWTESRKQTLYDSHVATSRVLARAAAELAPAVATLINVGGMGYYGNDTNGVRLVEDSPPGSDFAARVVLDKERATEPAAEAGVRVVLPRLGLVMGSSGSTFGRRLLPLAKAGLLGPLAGGSSIWSVVSISDTRRALIHLLTDEQASGPFNVSAPEATTNGEFTRLLGQRLGRPTVIPVPRFGISLVLGEFADDVLADFNIDPSKLMESGFTFEHPDAAAVIDAAVS